MREISVGSLMEFGQNAASTEYIQTIFSERTKGVTPSFS